MIAIFMKASASRAAYRTQYRSLGYILRLKQFVWQAPLASSVPRLVPWEHRLELVGKSLEAAAEIGCCHAQRLRHRLGLDRLLHRHRPFHGEHALGHGVGKGRSISDLAR